MNQNKSSSAQRGRNPIVGCRIKATILALAVSAASAPIMSATGLVIDTGTLNIGATGVLDLKDNALIVRTTPYATNLGYITTGYNGGDWLGFGINSSVAALDVGNFVFTVGLIDNADPFAGYTSFVGRSLTGAETLAKYTYYGDADLNGLVDSTDYFFIDNGFGASLTGWINGDFDYNGVVDSTDYFYIDNAFGLQGPPILPAPPVAGGVAVPEPGSLALLFPVLAVFAARRNKK